MGRNYVEACLTMRPTHAVGTYILRRYQDPGNRIQLGTDLGRQRLVDGVEQDKGAVDVEVDVAMAQRGRTNCTLPL